MNISWEWPTEPAITISPSQFPNRSKASTTKPGNILCGWEKLLQSYNYTYSSAVTVKKEQKKIYQITSKKTDFCSQFMFEDNWGKRSKWFAQGESLERDILAVGTA